MSERVSDTELQEMLDIMDEGESYLPEVDIEAALHDLVDARSGKALKEAKHRIEELERENAKLKAEGGSDLLDARRERDEALAAMNADVADVVLAKCVAECELDEASKRIQELNRDNARLGAILDSRTQSGTLEYVRLHDEVVRLRSAARAAGEER